jgi:hypothetical protein
MAFSSRLAFSPLLLLGFTLCLLLLSLLRGLAPFMLLLLGRSQPFGFTSNACPYTRSRSSPGIG